ncbi:MAG: gamma-glutamyl-gamma-aminobutyrate hydrolase family protein [Deltaproteobacteria bacterium]|jgi:putative glutamine amidotransferase|nr:gamma-glutamyl-gamma-aminobutyrate hydrolase family protein [Deltaproteobacteria bacterium]
MKKPIIGVTTTLEWGKKRHELWTAYLLSLERAGAIPVILPSDCRCAHYTQYASLIDGLLLSGGQDVLPQFYAQEPISGFKAKWPMCPARDEFEIELTKVALSRNLPILGICRGLQLLCVAAGGALHQDIDLVNKDKEIRLRHFQYLQADRTSHRVILTKGSLISKIVGSLEIEVNSLHHQAISRLPEGFLVSARAKDQVIEAMENPNLNFALGVQWHPEQLSFDYPEHEALFKALVEAASRCSIK